MDKGKTHAAILLALAVIALGPFPASALVVRQQTTTLTPVGTTAHGPVEEPDPPAPGEEPWCINVQVLGFGATPSVIAFDGSTVLSWHVQAPHGCEPGLEILGTPVPLQGSLEVRPPHSAVFHYRLYATLPGQKREIAVTAVTVGPLPEPPVGSGQTVMVNGNYPQRLIQALGTPRTTVILGDNVAVDLSNQDTVVIAGGVELYGNRSRLNPGPRIYTTTRQEKFLKLNGFNGPTAAVDSFVAPVRLRIAGVRLQGPDMGSVDKDTQKTFGLWIDSCEDLGTSVLDVEIYNTEIYGWNGAAIRASDACGRMHFPPAAVRIHDNYIHHNQHDEGNGYGVSVSHGAYALIERNVFDWNRHAIKADFRSGTGYAAYRNLVLKNGGYHDTYVGNDYYTHQFDVHGEDSCLSSFDCGRAGHSMHIRYNTFLYTRGIAIKLRGTPEVGMYVTDNVFAHAYLWDFFPPIYPEHGALAQTESGLYALDNVLGVDGSTQLGTCDFDDDDVPDSFMATGATWWYSSGGTMPWVYLNTSTKRLSQVTLGDVDGDGVCDVWADGRYSSGGTEPWRTITRFPRPVLGGGMLVD